MGNLQLKFFTEGMFPYGGCFHERVYVLCDGCHAEQPVLDSAYSASRVVMPSPRRLDETLLV